MRTTFKNDMSELMKKSWMLVRQYGFTMSQAMKKMWQVYRLKKQMTQGVAKFIYMKLDGTVRTAWGTLSPSYIPMSEGTTERRRNDTVTTYYDVEKQGYRCFKTANFMRMA